VFLLSAIQTQIEAALDRDVEAVGRTLSSRGADAYVISLRWQEGGREALHWVNPSDSVLLSVAKAVGDDRVLCWFGEDRITAIEVQNSEPEQTLS